MATDIHNRRSTGELRPVRRMPVSQPPRMPVIRAIEHQLQPHGLVRLRSVRPKDRWRIEHGFRDLSDETRYNRCFAHRHSLTDRELDSLCNVDGIRHVALMAVSVTAGGCEQETIGGAQFIRQSPTSDIAEMAFVVADAWQRKRVGQMMLRQLVAFAGQEGVTSLRVHLLPDNVKARCLLLRVAQQTGGEIRFDEDGGLLTIGASWRSETANDGKQNRLDTQTPQRWCRAE